MNKVLKITLISIVLNLLLALVLCIPFFFFGEGGESIYWLIVLAIVGVVSLALQLIVSIIFMLSEKRRQTGQGMMISVGLFLLAGFAFSGVV